MTKKLVAFQAMCGTEGKYIGIAPEEIIEDVKRDFYDACPHIEIIARDVDKIEIVSPKGRMKKDTRSNGNDILNVEIR